MSVHTMTVTLGDDETDGMRTYRVRYSYTPYLPAKISGPPEHCYPAEPAEISIVEIRPAIRDTIMHMGAFAPDAEAAEYERIEDYIAEHHADTYEADRDHYLEMQADERRGK